MTRRSGQRPFGEVERVLFRTYVNCQIAIAHPRELYQELNFTQAQLAIIARCNLSTMERWMSQDHEPRMLKEVYLRRLGEFRFLLRHYPQIPVEAWNHLCPISLQDRAILYPEQQ
ncbi:MAG TPA: hypothetical protein V6C84_07745 [Coleofasciculaceae cyanobacterium]|jgi:hypothetical protein